MQHVKSIISFLILGLITAGVIFRQPVEKKQVKPYIAVCSITKLA